MNPYLPVKGNMGDLRKFHAGCIDWENSLELANIGRSGPFGLLC